MVVDCDAQTARQPILCRLSRPIWWWQKVFLSAELLNHIKWFVRFGGRYVIFSSSYLSLIFFSMKAMHPRWLITFLKLNILVCAVPYLEASYPGFDFMNGTSGTILLNWKNQLGNSDQLTNWAGPSDPCGSNPWFNVLCNAGHVQRMWGLFATPFFSSWQQYVSAFPNLSKYLVKLNLGARSDYTKFGNRCSNMIQSNMSVVFISEILEVETCPGHWRQNWGRLQILRHFE